MMKEEMFSVCSDVDLTVNSPDYSMIHPNFAVRITKQLKSEKDCLSVASYSI